MELVVFLSLFCMFMTLFTDELPRGSTILSILRRYGLPLGCAALLFVLGSALFISPVAGFFLGIAGWYISRNVDSYLALRGSNALNNQAKDFLNSSTSLFMADNSTPQVVAIAAADIGDPLSSKLYGMLAERNMRGTTFPVLFQRLADENDAPIFGAMGKIIEAGSITGGPSSIAAGLNLLGDTVMRREHLLMERAKSNQEPAIAAIVVLLILAGAAFWDAFFLRNMLATNGLIKLSVSLGIGVIVALTAMVARLFNNNDLKK